MRHERRKGPANERSAGVVAINIGGFAPGSNIRHMVTNHRAEGKRSLAGMMPEGRVRIGSRSSNMISQAFLLQLSSQCLSAVAPCAFLPACRSLPLDVL